MVLPDQKFIDGVKMCLKLESSNNASMNAKAIGSIMLDNNDGRIDVTGVLRIPYLAVNLLSVSTICKKGRTVTFTKDKCEV